MTNLKDKVLNKDMRDLLMKFARANVSCPKEKAVLDAAYDKAKPLVMATAVKRFPIADMKVLVKYGAATSKTSFSFGGYYDTDSTFYFRTEEEAPFVPRHIHGDRNYEWSKETREVLNAYVLADQAHRKALDTKLRDYLQLISGSRTFNDVVAIWPAAEAMRATLIPVTTEQRALSVLSEEAVARLKKDNAGSPNPVIPKN